MTLTPPLSFINQSKREPSVLVDHSIDGGFMRSNLIRLCSQTEVSPSAKYPFLQSPSLGVHEGEGHQDGSQNRASQRGNTVTSVEVLLILYYVWERRIIMAPMPMPTLSSDQKRISSPIPIPVSGKIPLLLTSPKIYKTLNFRNASRRLSE